MSPGNIVGVGMRRSDLRRRSSHGLIVRRTTRLQGRHLIGGTEQENRAAHQNSDARAERAPMARSTSAQQNDATGQMSRLRAENLLEHGQDAIDVVDAEPAIDKTAFQFRIRHHNPARPVTINLGNDTAERGIVEDQHSLPPGGHLGWIDRHRRRKTKLRVAHLLPRTQHRHRTLTSDLHLAIKTRHTRATLFVTDVELRASRAYLAVACNNTHLSFRRGLGGDHGLPGQDLDAIQAVFGRLNIDAGSGVQRHLDTAIDREPALLTGSGAVICHDVPQRRPQLQGRRHHEICGSRCRKCASEHRSPRHLRLTPDIRQDGNAATLQQVVAGRAKLIPQQAGLCQSLRMGPALVSPVFRLRDLPSGGPTRAKPLDARKRLALDRGQLLRRLVGMCHQSAVSFSTTAIHMRNTDTLFIKTLPVGQDRNAL